MDDKSEHLSAASNLLYHKSWAALATVDDKGKPHASMIAYAITTDALYFHLSSLALHTRLLQQQSFCSIVISEDEILTNDPQTLARLSLDGKVQFIDKKSTEYIEGANVYQQRLPESSALFDFADFSLLKFIPEKARYVGGFGKALNFSVSELLSPTTNPGD